MNALVSRRMFVAAGVSVAGGLAVAIGANRGIGAWAAGPLLPESLAASGEVNAFVAIDPDNTVTVRIAKSEMGQGVMTSLAMIVAEELQCDFAKVKVEYASANRNFIDGAAAAKWKVEPSSCLARAGEVIHAASNRSATFGELAGDLA